MSLSLESAFLQLPAEIREQIYREILTSANSKCPPTDEDEPASYKYHLDILLVNRLIHHEAKKIFEDNIFVKITTPWPEAIRHIRGEGKVPSITTGLRAANFTHHHLWIFIDTPATSHLPDRKDFSMLICLEDLPAFTSMWHFSNLNHFGLNRHLRLKLTLQDPHVPTRKIPRALQSQLLLPFGQIKDLHTFSIHGPKLLSSVQDSLNAARALPDPTPEECLSHAHALKEAGNALLKSNDPHAALAKYVESFAAIHITVEGRSRTIHAEGYYVQNITSGPYVGIRGDFARMTLRVQLVANMVFAYLKLEEWAEAYFWGKRSVVLFRRSVTGDEGEEIGEGDPSAWLDETVGGRLPWRDSMGRIFYRTAIAARNLQKHSDVATLIKAAAICLPQDQTVQDELKALNL